jgi:hypothetical protein
MAAHELLVASTGELFFSYQLWLSAFSDRLSASGKVRLEGKLLNGRCLNTIEGSRLLIAERLTADSRL